MADHNRAELRRRNLMPANRRAYEYGFRDGKLHGLRMAVITLAILAVVVGLTAGLTWLVVR